MKQILIVFALLLSFSTTSSAQTLEEADLLYAGKKYMEAAEAYFQLYYFNKAVQSYQMQIDALVKAKKTQSVDSIKSLQEHAEKAARMLSRCEDIQIIDSLIVDKSNFLKAYFFGEETGTLEKTSAAIIYENQLKDRRFFGKRGADGLFRLNSQVKIQGSWSNEKQLNIPFDAEGSDNFPFVMPDGLTIYYASTGSGSIGGYDLFVSRYNLNNDTYLAPSRMGMPFNSIYNDFMLVIDEVNNIGFFASDRFQPEDKVIVYTFIPNPNNEYKPLEVDDEQVLRERAMISSIRDSWLPDANYAGMLEKIRADIEKNINKVQKDFTFAINDNIVYNSLSDFESDAAKNSFLQSKELEEKIRTLEEQLENRRSAFAKASREQKQTLRSPILANEQQLETMYLSYNKLLVEIRNSEIKYLRANN